MTASTGVMSCMEMKGVRDSAPATPTATPSSAFTSGNPAAVNERSITSSTMAATTTPMISPGPMIELVSCDISSEKVVVMPWSDSPSALAMTASRSSIATLCISSAKRICV